MPEQNSSRTFPALWVVLASLLSAFFIGTHRSSDDTSHSGAATDKVAAAGKDNGEPPSAAARGPLHDFFSTVSAPETEARWDATEVKDYEIQSFVMTVPDPVDSRFGYAYDELVAVLQRAMAEDSYVFDRASLPWEGDKKALARPAALTEKRPKVQAERDERPGIVLFRSDENGKLSLRIVYLVVENPTSGLSKRALITALNRVRSYPLGDKKDARQQFIGIVGPYFTGSQASLKMAIKDWQKANGIAIKIKVVSGSADGVNREEFFSKDDPASFKATVVPNHLVLKSLCENCRIPTKTARKPGFSHRL